MRVLFVTTTYPLQPGDSIPSFVADLAEALVRDHGVQVRVIAPHHVSAAREEVVNGVEIQRFVYADPGKQCVAYGGGIPDNLRNYPRARWQLPGFFAGMMSAVGRNLKWADLIHAHWVEPGFLSMLASHGSKPAVVSVHSLKPKASRLHRFALRRADRVLFNSRYTMNQAREKGYFPCQAEVVYQGYDDQLFGRQGRTNVMRGRLGISPDATLILSLGRMIEVKGLHVLAGAADAILGPRPNAHLVIAGDGPMRAEIERIVAQSSSRERIHLTGALPRAKVAQLFADADVFVNPGVVDSNGRAEGLGITTIEAMASGLACVGSRVGGIPETIVDGVTGLLVAAGEERELAHAVSGLVDDIDLRRRMGEAGRESARSRFTWPVLARQVAGVYKSISRRGMVRGSMSKEGQMTSAQGLPAGQRYDKDYAYGQYTADYYGGLLEKQNRASFRWRIKWLDRALNPQAGDKIVDLGCGAGLVARHFLKKGAEVHGVDLADEGIKAAIEINRDFPLGTFKVADASKCDYLAAGSFDKACSVDVIEHCGHDVMLDIFGEAHRLLKTGGLYYVYTPNPKHWIERFKAWGILKQDPTHTGLRPERPILDGLEQKGFEIVESFKPASMIPVFNRFEKAWSFLPGIGQLGIYRIAVLARKK